LLPPSSAIAPPSSFFFSDADAVCVVEAKANPPADEPNENPAGFELPPPLVAAPNPNPTGLPKLPEALLLLGGLPNAPNGLDVDEGIPNRLVEVAPAGFSLSSDLAWSPKTLLGGVEADEDGVREKGREGEEVDEVDLGGPPNAKGDVPADELVSLAGAPKVNPVEVDELVSFAGAPKEKPPDDDDELVSFAGAPNVKPPEVADDEVVSFAGAPNVKELAVVEEVESFDGAPNPNALGVVLGLAPPRENGEGEEDVSDDAG
jgi:hypothetical protein